MIQHSRNEVRILSESQNSEGNRKDASNMRLEIGVGLFKRKTAEEIALRQGCSH